MDERSLRLMTAFAQLDASPPITAVLMEMAALDKRWVRYMAGPVILHQSPWTETLPAWIIPAIYTDRAERIAEEVRAGTVGELALPLEVVAYLYPATIDAPLSYEWAQVYLDCGQAALTKHGKLPAGATFAQLVTGEDQPLALTNHIRSAFLIPLQRAIRRKVVQVASDRGVGKQSRAHPQSVGEETSAASNEEQTIPCRPQQMSLFAFGE